MLRITINNALILDGRPTGVSLAQRREGSVVYTPESRLSGQAYREHQMPQLRYTTSTAAGRAQLEADLRGLLTLTAMDLTHLHALELRLSHERARLGDGSSRGADLRRVWVEQLEREIAGERAHLGLPPAAVLDLSDDDLAAALGA